MKEKFSAIVLAAGKGKRMKTNVQKQFLHLDGKPLLYYSLKAFEDSPAEDIILVTGAEEIAYCRSEIVERYGFRKVRAIVAGGRERYHSVYEGLKELEKHWRLNEASDGDGESGGRAPCRAGRFSRLRRAGKTECGETTYVMIHDGARPFVDAGILERIMKDVVQYDACAAGMPSKDTVKLSDEAGFSKITPNRADVWTIQTPQAFSYPLIKEAYDKMMSREEYQQGVTDDAMVVETMTDRKVKLTEGSYRNLKVTTPEDMAVAEAFLAQKKG